MTSLLSSDVMIPGVQFTERHDGLCLVASDAVCNLT
jgi:hypothetical protein